MKCGAVFDPVARTLSAVLVIVLLLCPGASAWAQKTDLIYLKNGDRVTGEVKLLERGRLMVKTHSLGTLFVEWSAVDRVVSDKIMQLELADGHRVLGTLSEATDKGVLVAQRDGAAEVLPIDEVVRIDQVMIDRSFWQRLDGKIGLGVNYTKGSEVAQLYFIGNTRFRKVRSEYQLNWNTILTSNGTGTDSTRGNIGGIYRRYYDNRWFWTGLANIDKNDEIGIDGRVSAGGGGGRVLRQRKTSQISLVGGLVATHESTVSRTEDDTNLEGIFIGDLALFKFATPKTELRTTLTVWPSITDWGRVRGNLDATLGQEVFTADFSLNLTAYLTYDNQPPSGGQKEDYGFITSLNYAF